MTRGPRLLVAVILPLLLQILGFLLVADWAAGRGSGAGFLGIGALLLLLIAVPVTLVANVWMMKETGSWKLFWVGLAGSAQALVIPGLIVVALLLTIR
jgi:hypothetical protein